MIDEISRFHLFYILENKTQYDKYNGLSHVVEHTLLIPTDIGAAFTAKGYTCANHVCLYFSSSELTVLQEVDNLIMSGQIFTDKNVNIAKEQVKVEIASLREKTAIFLQIVNFVTDGRVTGHAIGELLQVEKIQSADVLDWFEQRVQFSQVHRYLSNDMGDIIVATQYTSRSSLTSELKPLQRSENAINILDLVSPNQVQTIRVYFRIPILTNKLDILKKGLAEYCVQRKISSTLGIDIDIYDKYFDVDERYVLMEFTWNRGNNFDEIIRLVLLEISCISYEDYMLYRTEFVKLLNQLYPYNESSYQVFNAIKNKIVYASPHIEYDDLYLIEQISYASFLKCQKMYGSVKVIVM